MSLVSIAALHIRSLYLTRNPRGGFLFLRVTIVKDKDTHKSKGVAFVLFLDRDSAHNCARAVNNKQVGNDFANVFVIVIVNARELHLNLPSSCSVEL